MELTEPITAPSVRMAGEERKHQILQVAVRLFSQRGFSGTTTREIAHAAGVSEAMVFRHFATKNELYAAILDLKACSAPMGDPRDAVSDAIARKDDRAVFEGLAFVALESNEQHADFQRLLLHSALEEHELSRMFWENTVLRFYEFLGDYVAERQRDGVFRPVEPKMVVRAFLGMLIHHSLNNNLWDRSRNLLNISNQDAAREFSEIILRGIRTSSTEINKVKTDLPDSTDDK